MSSVDVICSPVIVPTAVISSVEVNCSAVTVPANVPSDLLVKSVAPSPTIFPLAFISSATVNEPVNIVEGVVNVTFVGPLTLHLLQVWSY